MQKCFQVFLCVVYSFTNKLTHQFPLNVQVLEGLAPKIIPMIFPNSNPHQPQQVTSDTTDSKTTDNQTTIQQSGSASNTSKPKRVLKKSSATVRTTGSPYTVPWEKRRELVLEYFPYSIEEQYIEFYEWMYKVLTDIRRREERLSKALELKTTFIDYENLYKSTPFKIPELHQSWYAYVTAMESFFNITTGLFFTGGRDDHLKGFEFPPTRL